MDKKEAIKQLVRECEELDMYYDEFGKMTKRPWGYFIDIEERSSHKLKRICVYPGQRLSYQMHHKRSEVWTITEGCGYVVIDDIIQRVGVGSVVQIPAGRKHRIINDQDSDLQFIEVHHGEYFGEDDIVRYEDDYGRT